MFKRRTKELTTEDAPDSLGAWEMLDDAGIERETAVVRERAADPYLIAFARRADQDEAACFDKGPDGTGKKVVVVNPVGIIRRYPGFGLWFDESVTYTGE